MGDGPGSVGLTKSLIRGRSIPTELPSVLTTAHLLCLCHLTAISCRRPCYPSPIPATPNNYNSCLTWPQISIIKPNGGGIPSSSTHLPDTNSSTLPSRFISNQMPSRNFYQHTSHACFDFTEQQIVSIFQPLVSHVPTLSHVALLTAC
jgi:hypothetical protein